MRSWEDAISSPFQHAHDRHRDAERGTSEAAASGTAAWPVLATRTVSGFSEVAWRGQPRSTHKPAL
ncbi:hypothetical protein A8926_0569 [Saccharopolyspora spinosa]|uniref:Uncharacterized protein n=1 Tax=Saccharopolyspora spinosa TaxID=60894 RepID=A0A2N3XQX0_SACSN|nr:hypothetical protein A8926_0569 [Saccharopolyspora spinosa]